MTNNNSKSVEINNGTKRPSRKPQERLVILFGDAEGKCISTLHAFIRPLVWAILWALNRKLVSASAQKGSEAKAAAEQSLIRKVVRMVLTVDANEALEKAGSTWLTVALADKPEQAVTLAEVASALSDHKVRHYPLLLNFETGKGETPQEAAVRLIRAAVFHPNKVVAASYRVHRDMLVKAGIISVEKAKEATDAARKERDELAKKAAEARKAIEPSPVKDDKKKEEKKKAV